VFHDSRFRVHTFSPIMSTPKLVDTAKAYIGQYLLDYLPPAYSFHNFDYAAEVVETARQLAEAAELSESKIRQLVLAGWFIPTGYVGGADGAETRSAEIAAAFLKEQKCEPEVIQAVSNLLMSMRKDHMPQQLTEKLFFDARWSFLGKKGFGKKTELLRLEKEQVGIMKYSQYQWERHLLNLLTNTPFYTSVAKRKFGSRRNLNLSKLRQGLAEAQENELKTKTGKNFGRGVDTVYRITLSNHISLSSIADGKANMVININTPILTALIALTSTGISLSETLFQNKLLFIPILILMLGTLMAIFYAVLSVIPKVSGGNKLPPPQAETKQNTLYFGNFLNMEKEEFVVHMQELKKDQTLLYDELSRDLYSLGLVLQKKYRLLTYAYRAFITGLILSVFSFVVVYLAAL
jgi:predicted metal-dependent HD superfamily phosphohydrolase